MHIYKAWNGPMPTTSAQASASTGTAVKTMLQLAVPATRRITLLSWGYSIDTPQAAAGTVELLETDVGATITQHVASGLQPQDPGNPASTLLIATTGQTGYTASVEGAITATRVFDAVKHNSGSSGASPLMEHRYQFLPLEVPIISVSKFVRVRATMGTSTGMLCWICWAE